MAPEELFSQLSLWMVNLCSKSYSFGLFFIQYLHVWIRIRIHKAPEYGSESTTLVLTRVYGCDGTTEEN